MSEKIRICLLSKKRGNYKLQEKFSGKHNVEDQTNVEVLHHKDALINVGYDVQVIDWNSNFIDQVANAKVDLFFNVSSLVEAAVLNDLDLPFVGSGITGIALASDKSIAKQLWQQAGLPTSEFRVLREMSDCRDFISKPPFAYPLFCKPVSGRGSSGITENSIIKNDNQFIEVVENLLKTIEQPVLIEKFLDGREITVGIIGNGEHIRTLPFLEIKIASGIKALTFNKKEQEDDKFICPAELTDKENELIRYIALLAYKTLGLRDFARIDMKLSSNGPMLLEANSFAGLMCTPKEKPFSYMGFMARAEGKGGKELLNEIVETALERINHNK
jgi:D-alanine-D-alanine ligase